MERWNRFIHPKIQMACADRNLNMPKPHQWARRAIALYHSFEADAVLAEVKQGGEMVAAVLAAEDATVLVLMRRASRGKWLRAEPGQPFMNRGVFAMQGVSQHLKTKCVTLRRKGSRTYARRVALMYSLWR